MSTLSFEVVYLRPEQVRFERRGDTLGLTVMEWDGPQAGVRHYPRVVLRSCFPVSEEGAYLSVRDASDVLPLLSDDELKVDLDIELHTADLDLPGWPAPSSLTVPATP